MEKAKKNTKQPAETTTAKKTVTPPIDKDKSFSEREHGRTHDSPKSKSEPKTL